MTTRIGMSLASWTALLAAFAGTAAAQGFNPNEVQRNAQQAIAEARLNSMCFSAFPPGSGGAAPADGLADCGCAVDNYLAARGSAGVRDLDEKTAMERLGPYLERCRSARAGTSAKPSVLDMPPPVVEEVPVGSAAPATEAAETPVQEVTPRVEIVPQSERSGGLLAWLARSGLPLWIWVLLPVALGFAALVLMARRGRPG